MNPVLCSGDMVAYSNVGPIEEGHVIIFFDNDGELVVHRVLETYENGVFLTRGDNNSLTDLSRGDGLPTRGDVIGRVVWSTSGPDCPAHGVDAGPLHGPTSRTGL